MRIHPWAVVSGCLAVGLLLSTPARAQTSELPLYVSDQFKSVAKKASQQLITAHVTAACPADKPLCKPLVEQLAAAMNAALSKDEGGLERALDTFFLQSSVTGLVNVVLGDLTNKETSEYPRLAELLEPLGRCLVASVLAGRKAGQAPKECQFDPEYLAQLRAEFERLACQGQQAACKIIDQIAADLERQPVPVDKVVQGLAQLVEGDPFHRKRESIYLYSLGDFLARAPEHGLFEATWSFLTSPDQNPWIWEHLGVAERAIASGAFLEYRFLNATEDEQILQLLRSCGQPTEIYQEWMKARTALPAFREALLLGEDVEPRLKPLRALLKYTRCTGTESQQRQLRLVRGQVEYILAPLELRGATRRYGTLGLSAAALLDFVRTENEDQLTTHLARTLAFGVAQAVATQQISQRLRAERGKAPAPESRLTGVTAVEPGDLMGTCEFQRINTLLGQPYAVTNLKSPECFELGSGNVIQGLSDLVDLGEREAQPIAEEAKAFAQLLKHAYFQRHTPSEGLSAERLGELVQESERFLGEVMASTSPGVVQAWQEIRAALSRINASAGDLEARAQLQVLAFRLVTSVSAPASGPMLSEERFVKLMLDQLVPARDPRLDAFWVQWLGRKHQLAGQQNLSAAEQVELATLQARSSSLPPLRAVRAYLDLSEELRSLEAFKVLRGLLRALDPESMGRLDKLLPLEDLIQAVQDGLEQRGAEARRRVMRLGADFLVTQVDLLALQLVGSEAARCQEKSLQLRTIFSRIDAACTAHFLIQGAYHPIADFLSAGGISAPGAARLADTTYRQLIQSPALATAPVILNVGLGVNWVSPNHPDSDFLALTVVDKFGVALLKYNGERTSFEVGPFVGGFLDALVRTAAGVEEKYWLGGLAAGFPRIAGLDLGVEAHAGGAFTFTLDEKPRLALGLTVIVPFSTVLDPD